MIETPSFRSRIHQTTSKLCRPHPLIEKMILPVEILEPFMLMGASGWFPRIGELFLLILSSQPPLLPWRYCPLRSFFSVSTHHTPCTMFQPLKSILFTALLSAATIQLFSDPGTCSGCCWAQDQAIISGRAMGPISISMLRGQTARFAI
jgi:hypothetical protein